MPLLDGRIDGVLIGVLIVVDHLCKLDREMRVRQQPTFLRGARGCHASPTRSITGESAGHGSGGGDSMGDSRRIMIRVSGFTVRLLRLLG